MFASLSGSLSGGGAPGGPGFGAVRDQESTCQGNWPKAPAIASGAAISATMTRRHDNAERDSRAARRCDAVLKRPV
jgi:hypothetical protein